MAAFRTHALAALRALGARAGVGILAGGTGFWLRAVTAGLDTDALPSDPGLRVVLEAELSARGLAPLVERLRTTAPALAERTDRKNPRRVVRALEIALLQGDAPLPAPLGYPAPLLGVQLAVEPAAHRQRIGERARAQFAAGLVEEARTLRERWDPTLPCFTAIGYREAWAHLDGEVDLATAIELDAARNIAFAKRQRTWFRAEHRLEPLDATGDPYPAARRRVEAFLATLQQRPA